MVPMTRQHAQPMNATYLRSKHHRDASQHFEAAKIML